MPPALVSSSSPPDHVVLTTPTTTTTTLSPTTKKSFVVISDETIPPHDCVRVSLETIDDCVAFAEGIDAQRRYEDEQLNGRKVPATNSAPTTTATTNDGNNNHVVTPTDEAPTPQPPPPPQQQHSFFPDVDSITLCGTLDGDDTSNSDGDADVLAASGHDTARASIAPQGDATLDVGANDDDDDEKEDNDTIGTATSTTIASPSPPHEKRIKTKSVSIQTPPLSCAICSSTATPVTTMCGNTCKTASTMTTFAHLPCCGSNGREELSNTGICTSCIVMLSDPTSDGSSRIGRCPRCRTWITVVTPNESSSFHNNNNGLDENISIELVDTAGVCTICQRLKAHLVDKEQSVCDSCFVGMRYPLVYECRECGGKQSIAHPMYRYQRSVGEFGTCRRRCEMECKSDTQWRILPDQIR